MFASFFRALLLVAFVGVVSAHGRVYRLQNKVLVTSSSSATVAATGDAASGSNDRRNLLSLEGDVEKDDVFVAARAASSVVQDWSLVCKQLCGAGLGGVPCVAHCSTAAEKVTKKLAAAILNPNKDLICQDLCGLQLGGAVCNCTVNSVLVDATSSTAPAENEHNAVCSSFCNRNGSTLVGCSLCRDEANDSPRALTAGVDGGAENEGDGSNLGIATTAITGAPIITTTPNWDVLCVSLCKTGDGGSLCNCDLSPFFN